MRDAAMEAAAAGGAGAGRTVRRVLLLAAWCLCLARTKHASTFRLDVSTFIVSLGE